MDMDMDMDMAETAKEAEGSHHSAACLGSPSFRGVE